MGEIYLTKRPEVYIGLISHIVAQERSFVENWDFKTCNYHIDEFGELLAIILDENLKLVNS
jgi:hypothetical protein